ncbi:LysR family transcriptional regulator [Castellaniella denitrificans]|uniref:LysR family transcriptional regulator n=1 Tax=Castellaniella denitrificans TaxID=56119 RepID=UPI001ACCBE00|nr:LysR family transcriptional regulator [Burkholderiales bacterium]
MINLRSLEIFYWAVQLKSFSRAAEKLNTTQPTISQRIAGLEEQFGMRLVNRATKPFSLTESGRALLAHAELILRQVAKLEHDLGLSGRVPRTIRLGVSETIVHTWLARFLEESHRCFPNIDFDITVDVTPSMMSTLQAGEIDIALMLGPANDDKIACVHLVDYPLQFYAAPGFVRGNRLTIEELKRLPIITYPRNAYPFSHLREQLFRLTDQTPRIFTNSSLATIERMAADRIGVALVAQHAFSLSLVRGALVAMESDLEMPPLSFCAFYVLGVNGEILERLVEIARHVATTSKHAEAAD